MLAVSPLTSHLMLAGSLSQLAVSTSLVNISREAVTRFSPEERKCYDVDHDDIRLAHLTYSDDFRYYGASLSCFLTPHSASQSLTDASLQVRDVQLSVRGRHARGECSVFLLSRVSQSLQQFLLWEVSQVFPGRFLLRW